MNFFTDYSTYWHVDGRMRLNQFLILIVNGFTIPIVLGDLNDNLSTWRKHRERSITLLYPVDPTTAFAYHVNISSAKYEVYRKKFGHSYFLYRLHEFMDDTRHTYQRNFIGTRTGIDSVIRRDWITDQMRHHTITYPKRGDTSWLLDEFVTRFQEVTGQDIPVPSKK